MSLKNENPSALTKDSPLKAWIRALKATEPLADHPTVTLPVAISDLAERVGSAPALLAQTGSLSFRELADRINQYARWALERNLGHGDVVGLMMPNGPEYVALWLGLSRLGVVVALININLTGAALAHAIKIVAPKVMIVEAALAGAYAAVRDELPLGIRDRVYGETDGPGARLDRELAELPTAAPDSSSYRAPTLADRALYIYTSGTTGLPKAANVSHFRLMQWSYWFAGMIDIRPEDRLYNCLPMYHSVGGVVAIGAPLVRGASVLISPRFSASRIWDEIVDGHCTLLQYIGELCRYLVNSPAHPRELEHRLRLCCGNGLRADVWEEFQRRFRIPRILEFYAATEGNFSLYNCEGKPGAIGRMPSFLGHRSALVLARFDVATNQHVRNPEGFCMRCTTDEVGEALGRITSAGHGRFEGYADAAASEAKILRDVFTRGDAWFRTGDLMRQDAQGFFYFVDRIGDTFRWKGENVSTTEVAETIATAPGITEAVVYGVPIPGTEGRAGMAAVAVNPDFDFTRFRQYLDETLPPYARPVFLRIRRELAVTETFKAKKQELAHEGYDPGAIKDALYFNHPTQPGFVRLDRALYTRIRAEKIRL